MPALKRYFAKQKEKHRKQTYQEELLLFLHKYEMPYDPQFIWT